MERVLRTRKGQGDLGHESAPENSRSLPISSRYPSVSTSNARSKWIETLKRRHPGKDPAVFAGWQPQGFGAQRPAKEGGEHSVEEGDLGEVLTSAGSQREGPGERAGSSSERLISSQELPAVAWVPLADIARESPSARL